MGITFTRKQFQGLQIGEAIVVVKNIERRRIMLHIEAPPEIFIGRLEAEPLPDDFPDIRDRRRAKRIARKNPRDT